MRLFTMNQYFNNLVHTFRILHNTYVDIFKFDIIMRTTKCIEGIIFLYPCMCFLFDYIDNRKEYACVLTYTILLTLRMTDYIYFFLKNKFLTTDSQYTFITYIFNLTVLFMVVLYIYTDNLLFFYIITYKIIIQCSVHFILIWFDIITLTNNPKILQRLMNKKNNDITEDEISSLQNACFAPITNYGFTINEVDEIKNLFKNRNMRRTYEICRLCDGRINSASGSRMITLQCDHFFHENCIINDVHIVQCPICYTDINIDRATYFIMNHTSTS
jgi:hypothetical protein